MKVWLQCCLYSIQTVVVVILGGAIQQQLKCMREDSTWRINLARSIAPAYAAHPSVEAIFVFGSVAYGVADHFSDLELGIVWSESPSESDLEVVAEQAGATDWRMLPFLEAKQSWSDVYFKEGLLIELAHWSYATIEAIITDVVERYDVSQNRLMFEKQATVSMLQYAEVLYGEAIIQEWRQRVADYPEALAIAMVQKHLQFSPFDSREMLAVRHEIPLLYENHCHSVRLLINLLFGLNRIYHPTFKWTRYFVEQMTIVPHNFFTRLEKVFQSDPVGGTQELRSLIEETFDLVELHLPQVDLAKQRQVFSEPYLSWKRSS